MTEAQHSQPLRPQLDHAVINVSEQLNQAAQQFRRLGFHLTPRGHHSLGSSNHLAVFSENYLELLGYEPGNAHTRTDLWQAPLGLTGLVWKTQNSPAVYEHLQQQHIAGSAPAEFFRPVALNDGTSPNARFRTVPLAASRVPNGRSFFCHHLTPELVWRNEWQNHPNGVADITGFVISADSPQDAAQVYGELFGAAALDIKPQEVVLRAGRATIRFITPAQATAEFGVVPEGENGSARMIGLEFATRSLDAVRNSLRVGEIAFDDNTSQVNVRAADALGVALKFSEE
ncbi:VOC family protein [Rahnella sp. SL6]|uniref:VOC family protein n=1 Tax=Rahnella perminowiae TaxID=2816244 RepID=A0ABS6L6X1_9GAMM|nr:VOC family protein [Rahnella perminowiae]MBU9809906.1 VOC family protein [Rahnella perminowiae]MBU9824357.1 VOC family protein [Rahnella perminowiae]MBU9837554.1 VOC family protein [Rahnella perminowiae]MCR9000649.1 VOC family protein [Rahnella perminowiae]